MAAFLTQCYVIIKKDLLLEFRRPTFLLSLILFGFLLLLLFSFALSVEPELMTKMAPGLFWLATFFIAVRSLDHSMRREGDDGQLSGLLLTGMNLKALYLGKTMANLIQLVLVQLVLVPLMIVLFGIPVSGELFFIILLGSSGIVIVGTAYSGMMLRVSGGQALLPLLLFPMLVPVLLAAVKGTQYALVSDVFGLQDVWIRLLLLFDGVYLLGSLLAAEVLFDNG